MFLQLFISLFLFFSFNQSPSKQLTDSYVTYAMKHKLHAWEGTSNKINVATKWDDKNELEQISVLIKVSHFNSGLSNRDSHMLEVLDAITYPNITFSSTSLVKTKLGLLAKGRLQFHGVTKEIEVPVEIEKTNEFNRFKGNFSVLLDDYKITRPSLLFVKVDNELKIRFQFSFK